MVAREKMERVDPPTGEGIDRSGGPVVDPTKNVLDLVRAAVTRMDDMSALRERLFQTQISALNSEVDLRAEHYREIRGYEETIRTLESSRLNAIRQVDVLAVQTTAVEARTAIQALAVTTASNADTLRNALNTTATTIAAQLTDTVSQITTRIAALEKSSYEGAGKQAVADPALATLAQSVQQMVTAQAQGSGKSQGSAAVWAAIALAITIILGLIGIAAVLSSRNAPIAATSPQVVYVPAPTGTLLPSPGQQQPQSK